MKNRFWILTIGVLVFSLSSCIENLMYIRGNGIIKTETRRSGEFYKLENSTSIDVVYKKADTTGITITGDENLIEYIVTETNNGTLEIKKRDGSTHLDFKEKPLITITSPKLEEVFISGSGDFFASELSGNVVIIKISGSGDITGDKVDCKNLTAIISGSGDINIQECIVQKADMFLSGSGDITASGESDNCDIKITGSGEVFANYFIVGSASVIISGSGDAFTNIEDELTAILSGSGDLYLKGNPAISKKISGSGRIIRYK